MLVALATLSPLPTVTYLMASWSVLEKVLMLLQALARAPQMTTTTVLDGYSLSGVLGVEWRMEKRDKEMMATR